MQPATVPSGSGRRCHARPSWAPIQTSGSLASGSPPASTPGSVVRITSSAPRAKRSFSTMVCPECSCTFTFGLAPVKARSTRGTRG